MTDIPTFHDSWPAPSRRWRSFEAEAWPVTAWRYDIAQPNVATQIGSNIIGTRNINTAPAVDLFKDNTIFSSASTRGVNHFLENDANNFKKYIHECKFRTYAENISAGRPATKPPTPYLYKIKTDTHNSTSVSDIYEQFGDSTFTYIYRHGRSPLRKDDRSKTREITNFLNRHPGVKERLRPRLENIYTRNDEIHIRGPLKKSRIGDHDAHGSFTFASCEWLDLAV